MGSKTKAYQAALYMRLSKDDDGPNESASIGSQRKLLRSYANEHNFNVYDEYVDDGYSGTNFQRPNWKRMIADIEDKKVNMVITKDLSRLGREYITAGRYTEIYFPSKGIRYIAVNDGYDSASPCTDIAPIKNVINEMYARDISRKIRSSFQTKMREGAYIGNFAPYGYRKDPENKNHLLIDWAVAPIVQELFRMAGEGSPPSEIARIFNDRGIMTPAMYRCSQRPYLDVDSYSTRKEWTSSMVCKMLSNMVYLGHIVQGKTSKVSFKSHVTLQKPRDEWIIVRDMHEPIISQEIYDDARKRCVARRNTPKSDFINIFSGIAKCADCGRGMSTTASHRKGSAYNLVCSGYKLYGSRECSNHFMRYDLLYQVVARELQTLLALNEAEKKEIVEALQRLSELECRPHDETVLALQRREKEIDRIIERLYEDKVTGKLEENRFYKLLFKYETEQKETAALLALQAKPKKKRPRRDDYSALDEITCARELSPELVRKLIDRIEIGQGTFEQEEHGRQKRQAIRIYYKFAGGSHLIL